MVNDPVAARSDNSVHPLDVDITNEESEDYVDEDVVDSTYFGNDIEGESSGLETDALSYNDASSMIFTLPQFVARVPLMRLSDVTSVEMIYVDNEGNQHTTMRPVEEFFSTNEMEVKDHNLYHVISHKNAQGKSTDANYMNLLDFHDMVDRPPTKYLNGINEDGYIHPVKVVGKGMHNVWLVPAAGAIGWAIVHYIRRFTMPWSRKFTLYVITPEYRRRHHIIQFSIPWGPRDWTQVVSPFIAPRNVSLPTIKGLRQITIDMNNYHSLPYKK
mmetsp:Transcript_45173/g.45740  ORF Transcript_45173/g.45740 Transcript_45173/m.45740 type:complete len:272 (+) Transcript_45173:505-1320(+)